MPGLFCYLCPRLLTPSLRSLAALLGLLPVTLPLCLVILLLTAFGSTHMSEPLFGEAA